MTISILTAAILGYIGPGGGIGLLGPLFGVLMAVVGALAMVAIWPIRYLFKKRRSGAGAATATTAAETIGEALGELTDL